MLEGTRYTIRRIPIDVKYGGTLRPLRILIADDHDLMRPGVRSLLEEQLSALRMIGQLPRTLQRFAGLRLKNVVIATGQF